MILLSIGGIMFLIGFYLLYSDYKKDPYGILKLVKYQFQLWWRLKGPTISRKPYVYYFPTLGILSQDIYRNIGLSTFELTEGASKVLKIKTPELCPKCKGKRGKSLSVQVECSDCREGVQVNNINSVKMPLPCKRCLGTGWIPIEKCETCNGEGCTWKSKKLKVQIPPQSSSGVHLRIPKQGKIELKSLQKGDLILKLRNKVFGFL